MVALAPIAASRKGRSKYSATVFGDKGVSTAGIYGHGVPVNGIVPTTDKYVGYEGLAIEIAKFFKGGPVPVRPEETLEIFALLKAAEASKSQNGAVVRLKNLAQGIVNNQCVVVLLKLPLRIGVDSWTCSIWTLGRTDFELQHSPD